jgi:glycosyltransferase involved in cell wall biosynthesis
VLFSILVCSFNGAERLPATLRALAAINLPPKANAELLVVNNASTDNSDNVVSETWEMLGMPFELHLLHMPLVGKGNALALGMKEAKGEYVVICDDDNWLSKDYLIIADNYLSTHPAASIIAGQAVAVADNPLPDWFPERQWAYACGQQPVAEGNTTGYKLLWSAGMIIQRDLANTIFNGQVPMLLLGRTGKELISGEDDEICFRAWMLGKETHYVPALCFKHYMAPHRLTMAYFEKLVAGFAHQNNAVGAYQRCYQLMKYRGPKTLLLIKKWLMRQWYLMNANYRHASNAADTLFFLTGNRKWETPENRQVKSFYEKVVLPQNNIV